MPGAGRPPIRDMEREAAVGLEPPRGRQPAGEEVRPADEAGDEAVRRKVVELLLGPDLLDHAARHDDQAVGHRQRFLLIVGDHQGREPQGALELADLDPHLLAELGVEVRERLVEEEQLRLDDERAGQRHALLLAARQLAREAVAEALEADQAQRLRDLLPDGGRSEPAHLEPEGDVLGGREVGEEGVALEDEPGVPPVGRQHGDVAGAEPNAAGRRLDESPDHAEGRRLAAPAGPEQDDQLALLDGERDIADDPVLGVALRQPLEDEP